MAEKKTSQIEVKLKGQVIEVGDEGEVKVQITKPNSVDEDQYNMLDLGKMLLDFCKEYEEKEENIELTCTIKAIK